MSGDAAAIGDVISGGIAASAVEGALADGRGQSHGGICLNCKTALIGSHCHKCGQHGHVHRTLAEFWHELLHSVFHFDGKIWRTLPMLLFRPGELTRRYIDGERARFISPIALFLFSVFAMFAVYGSLAAGSPSLNGASAISAELNSGIQTGVAARKAALQALESDRAQTATTGDAKKVAAIDDQIRNEREQIKLGEGITSTAGLTQEKIVGSMDLSTGIPMIDKGFEKAKKNPDLFLYKLQGSAYKYSWALIPLSLPLLWLIFAWRREFKLYDHIVFITYSLCFMSVLSIILSLTSEAFDIAKVNDDIDSSLLVAALIIPPIHVYFQVKGAYRLGTGAALARTGYLLFASMFVFVIFVLLLIVLGALG